jgi:hypothetical protein
MRNKYCNDRPFVSPILLENSAKQCWLSADKLNEITWNTAAVSIDLRKPIEIDYHDYFYIWKSDCKNVHFKLNFSKTIVIVKYPIRVPKSANDEFEQKLEHFKTKKSLTTNSKYLFKYTWNEEEFSTNHLPIIWEELFRKMLVLIDNSDKC